MIQVSLVMEERNRDVEEYWAYAMDDETDREEEESESQRLGVRKTKKFRYVMDCVIR